MDSAVASSPYEGGECVSTINSYCCNSLLDQGLPISKEVCLSCVGQITSFVDFGILLRQFQKHKIFDFVELSLTNNTKDVELMLKMLAAIENGFQIFYKCLRETQHICPGHREVANLLEKKGIIFDSWPCFYCYITAPSHGFPSTKYPPCPEDDDIKVRTLICDVNCIYCV